MYAFTPKIITVYISLKENVKVGPYLRENLYS